MSRRASQPIIPLEDAELDDPDTGLIERLRDSERPEQIRRAHRLAAQKIQGMAWRMAQRNRLRKK